MKTDPKKHASAPLAPAAAPLQLSLLPEHEPGEASWPAPAAITPVVLCGGTGARLWPLSRRNQPEPFVPLAHGHTLLEQTLERLAQFGPPARSVLCVASEEHRFLALEALKATHIAGRLVLEPQARGNAAAMALAALASPADALLLFCPADQHIPDTPDFVDTVQRGVRAAQGGAIVGFGVVPGAASSTHNYLELGTRRPDGCHSVRHLIHQPAPAKARRLLLQGGRFWNTGVYLSRADTLLKTLAETAPDILQACQAAMAAASRGTVPAGEHAVFFVRPHTGHYLTCRPHSFEQLLAKPKNLVMLPFAGRWSDVGNWNAVAQLVPADTEGNHVHGQGHALQARNTFVHAPHRTVLALGTQDLVIVDTPYAVLVAHRDHTEQLSAAVAQLEDNHTPLACTPQKVSCPWGWHDSVQQGERHQVRRIGLKPGASLGLQKHHHRAEHWIVVKGTAQVTRSSNTFLLAENQSTFIPVGESYRVRNPGRVELEMVEVQSGSYLGEDDVVHLEESPSGSPQHGIESASADTHERR